jgi:molybdopterin molybdotransferase
MRKLMTTEQARMAINEALPLLPAVSSPLGQCAGQILRESITADRPFPPFDRSMMDGYAIRVAEIDPDGIFEIVTQAPAGIPEQSLGEAKQVCAEIMTGAVVPSDADCVVQYEVTRRIDQTHMELLNPSDHTAGDFIHTFASDRPAGETLLEAGVMIGAREIAIAASCGCDSLLVSKRPSIVIVSTGDELVDVATTPAPHQIRRSNDVMIAAALKRVGIPDCQFVHLPDEPETSKAQLARLIEANDVVIISGGISMGKKDYIPSSLDRLGLTCQFHGVAQKPGKPLGFWSHPDCAVFTLPGNPLSTLTCLHHYVIPALFRAMGQAQAPIPNQVVLDAPVKARDDLTIFLPVKRNAANQVSAQPANNSGDLVRILQSDGYIELSPTPEKSYPAGKSVDFHPWY